VISDKTDSRPGFIVGGGPSLRGFDFTRLEGLRCMAVNVAFKDVPWAEVAYVGDSRLLDLLAEDKDWAVFAGSRYTRANKLAKTKKLQPATITGLTEIRRWAGDKGNVVGLGNAGLSALNLAEHLGWNPIFLLGFDCAGYRKDGRMDNYHDRYPKMWAKPGTSMRLKFTRAFAMVTDDIKAQVYNCNPASELECFPKITLEKAFKLC